MSIENLIYSFGWLLGILIIWDLIWRALALWKAAIHNQSIWFVFLLLVNSVGILPIIYISFFQKDRTSK